MGSMFDGGGFRSRTNNDNDIDIKYNLTRACVKFLEEEAKGAKKVVAAFQSQLAAFQGASVRPRGDTDPLALPVASAMI